MMFLYRLSVLDGYIQVLPNQLPRDMFVWLLKFILDGTGELVLQPTRFMILRYMQRIGEPQYVDQIARAVGVHPRLVSHHLDVLEDEGLVESEYRLMPVDGSSRKVAKRMCVATARASAVLEDIAKSVQEVGGS